MPPIRPCPACGRHVLGTVSCCPHCEASLRPGSVLRTAAAVALGLAVAGAAPGCAGDQTTTKSTAETGTTSPVSPDYGTSGYTPTAETGTTETGTTETGTTETGTTETGTTETGDTGTTSTTGTTSVDYGVTY